MHITQIAFIVMPFLFYLQELKTVRGICNVGAIDFLSPVKYLEKYIVPTCVTRPGSV